MLKHHGFSITFSRSLFALLITGLFGTELFAQKDTSTAATPSDIVELPTLTVTDTRELPEPEKWAYQTFQKFEVISSASDRTTTRLIRDFDLFTTAVDAVWPLKTRPMPPTAIILCKNTRQFESFLPPRESDAKENRSSAFFSDPERGFIVLNLGLTTINADALEAGADPVSSSSVTLDVDYNKQLYRSYVRYRFSLAETPLPVWYEEGVSQILMNMDVRKREIIIGELDAVESGRSGTPIEPGATNEDEDTATPSAVVNVPDSDFHIALRKRALMPLAELFSVTRDSPNALNPIGNNRWAKQCYAIVHLCEYGRGGRFKAAFDKFIERTRQTPATEEIFKECFGMTYKDFMFELRGYINFTNYRTEIRTVKDSGTLESPISEIRPATEGEAARIKGDAFRVAGQAKAARDTLAAAYIRGERDPQFLSTLGQAELANGNSERALKFITAGASKTDRPSVLIDLAQLRLEAAIAQPAGADKKINDAQLTSVLNPLFATRARQPIAPRVYELIASAWLVAERKPNPQEHLIVLTEGIKTYPQHAGILYHSAELYAHIGQVPTARALVSQGLKVATTDADRARLNALKTKLTLASAPTAPAAK
jgi:tetratricopeptide (TPR) repeat protein